MAEQNPGYNDEIVSEREPLIPSSSAGQSKENRWKEGETEHESKDEELLSIRRCNETEHPSATSADGGDDQENQDTVTESQESQSNGCKESCKRCFFGTGNNFIVALGVVVLAIVFAIMLVNWAKLILYQGGTSIMVLIVLITFNIFGIISIAGLFYSRRNQKPDDPRNELKITFLEIKLYSLYAFGLCYFFHCGLYTWKHVGSDCPNKWYGFFYNLFAMLYTFLLFLYFNMFHKRHSDNSKLQNFFSVGILFANVCIWLDALFSESNDLFQYHNDIIVDTNETDFIMFNITNSTAVCKYPKRAMTAIEKTEPFFSPAIIEFSLMAIDLLFSKTEVSQERSTALMQNDIVEVKLCYILIRKFCQSLVSLASFALFALTFTIVIIQDRMEDTSNFRGDFTVYVSFQICFKCIMLVLILFCISVVWTNMKYRFNAWAMVLLISCFGNVVNHMLYCFALTLNKGQKEIPAPILAASWFDNIISITLAFFQTLYLLGTHSHIEYSGNCCCKDACFWLYDRLVNYMCFFIGMMNLGLWIGDSIGEGRVPVLSYPMYQAYDSHVWTVIVKLVLPLTIFFRFHTGLSFMEMYWDRDKVILNKKDIHGNIQVEISQEQGQSI